ncbi:hypothetical protein ACFL5V_06960 [Fibrobacterota bacterium]
MSATKLIMAVLFLFLAALTQAAVSLEGIIETAEEDDNYQAVEVNLMVDETAGGKLKTEYYRIDNSRGRGKELLGLLESMVKVTGAVRGGKDGLKLLTVSDYEILEKHEPETLPGKAPLKEEIPVDGETGGEEEIRVDEEEGEDAGSGNEYEITEEE